MRFCHSLSVTLVPWAIMAGTQWSLWTAGNLTFWGFFGKWKTVKSLRPVQLFMTPWTDSSSLPGSSVHGILQARILEWVTIRFSRGSSWPSSPALWADSLPSELFIFDCTGSLLGGQAFSSCRQWGASHQLWCLGFSLPWLLSLGRMRYRFLGSVVAEGFSCPVACGVLPDQGWNLYPLHQHMNS